MTETNPLIVFTPSGKRGRFPVGTPVLQAARALGVDIDSVCGGRAICGRCQINVGEGEFAKHGITSTASHVSGVTKVEERYDKIRGLPAGRRRVHGLHRGHLGVIEGNELRGRHLLDVGPGEVHPGPAQGDQVQRRLLLGGGQVVGAVARLTLHPRELGEQRALDQVVLGAVETELHRDSRG